MRHVCWMGSISKRTRRKGLVWGVMMMTVKVRVTAPIYRIALNKRWATNVGKFYWNWVRGLSMMKIAIQTIRWLRNSPHQSFNPRQRNNPKTIRKMASTIMTSPHSINSNSQNTKPLNQAINNLTKIFMMKLLIWARCLKCLMSAKKYRDSPKNSREPNKLTRTLKKLNMRREI